MTSTAVRANFFDASALVKLHVQEEGSHIIRPYFNGQPTKYTTPFCHYEALNVLKVKWLYRREIAKEQYLDAALRLTAWFGSMSRGIKGIDFTEPKTFQDARRLVDKTSLDLSDAFQILSVKTGYFSPCAATRKPYSLRATEGWRLPQKPRVCEFGISWKNLRLKSLNLRLATALEKRKRRDRVGYGSSELDWRGRPDIVVICLSAARFRRS